MRCRSKVLVGALLTLLFGSVAIAGNTDSINQRAALQAAMQLHIERSLVNGAYLHLNMATGTVRTLAPVKAHPVILKMGKYYVLCSDFRDENGEAVNIDYYVAVQGRSYVVFHSEVDNRNQLMALMKQGKVKQFE